MMSKVKLVMLDIDGTLVEPNRNSLPSQKVIDAVTKARQSAQVSVITGRAKLFSDHVIDALGLTGPSVFDGGADIRDVVTNEQVLRCTLSVDMLRELVRIAHATGHKVFTEENHYEVPIDSPSGITIEGTKLLIVGVPRVEVSNVLDAFSDVSNISLHPVLSWNPGDVMNILITRDDATKSHAVNELMNRFGVEKSEVLAIGDGHNDVPLFEAAGIAVAMGNAPQELKAMADYVAPSLKDDGVAYALAKYF